MHILVTRFSSMGDVVLTTATINWLHSIYGSDLDITFVTSQEFTSLVKDHPAVKTVIGFDRRKGEKWTDLISKVRTLERESPVDLILDLHATMRSFRLRCSFWKIPALTVDKRRWERFFLTKPIPGLKKIFKWKIFGLEPQVVRVLRDFESIFGDPHAVRRTENFLQNPHDELTSLKGRKQTRLSKPYIVVAPSASFFYKRWPVSMFVELTRELLNKTDLDIVILAGPEDKFCDVFNEITDAHARLHNLQGKTSLSESMDILKGAKSSIGNDSGMNHIAEAFGVPAVTIFGPTDPLFGFAPHGSKSITLSKDLWCKPCSTTGAKKCFRDKHYCMEMISVKEVLDAGLSSLERA